VYNCSPATVESFVDTLTQLKDADPLFVDVTWFLKNQPGSLSVANSSTSIAITAQRDLHLDTMLHLTCTGFSQEQTQHYLQQALDYGINNVLALRGDDPPNGGQDLNNNKNNYFAIDLVRWARQIRPDKGLSVAVAGHPVGHPAAKSYVDSLVHLKKKVDAGADFVVTQFFFDVKDYERFLLDARRIGITVPILPGILLFKNAESLERITQLSSLVIPSSVSQILASNRKNVKTIQNYALHLAYEQCHYILSRELSCGVHLFTLNQREMTSSLVRRLGFWLVYNSAEGGLANSLAIQAVEGVRRLRNHPIVVKGHLQRELPTRNRQEVARGVVMSTGRRPSQSTRETNCALRFFIYAL